MGARPAVGVIHRRELGRAQTRRPSATVWRRHADTQLRPQVAAATGYVDELIEPWETRAPARDGRSGRSRRGDELGDILLTGATGFVGMELVAATSSARHAT